MRAAPPWLSPVYDAVGMRALDSWAIAREGIPSLDLMERAGSEAARVVLELNPQGPVRIVCGKGNNGGDGLVVARLLREHGIDAAALLLWSPDELSSDAKTNHARLLKEGGTAREVEAGDLPDLLEGSGLVVDAMLGTGFEGAPRAPLDAAIEAVNRARSAVLAVDVPSGVNASTGEVAGAGVRAIVTVTFDSPKVGLCVAPGKALAGRVETVDIGIPASGDERPGAPAAGLIEPSVLDLLPPRTSESNKFSAGTVLVIGGSRGLTGAVCLACDGAMRAGAGWVRAGVPASLNEVFEIKLTEVMTVPLDDRDASLTADALEAALEAAARATAVVIGPGMGRQEETFELVRLLVERLDRPLLVDADALNALAAGGLDTLGGRRAATVLTPHAGELARLLGTDSAQVSSQRLASAREAAARAGALILLKGDDTLVVEPGERVAVSAGGSPALATAGTGDVLSGMIAAFMARGLDAFAAACAGVWAHAAAGRRAADLRGTESVIASDVIEAIPSALRRA